MDRILARRSYFKLSSRMTLPSLPLAILLVTRSVRVKLSCTDPLGGGIKMKYALEREDRAICLEGDIHNGQATEEIHYSICPPQALS